MKRAGRWDMRKITIHVGMLFVIVLIMAGCTTFRQVDRGEVDELNKPPAPGWAVRNAHVVDTDPYTYFVGISQEHATSEEEAIEQAYLDAARRLSDAIGYWLSGTETVHARSKTKASEDWPHRMTRKPVARKWDHEGSGRWEDVAANTIHRDQVIGKAQIVDTWVVREKFWSSANPSGVGGRLNYMKYGELWKAKILLRVPTDDLHMRANREYEIRQREVNLQFEPTKIVRPTFHFGVPGYRVDPDYDSSRGTHFISYRPTNVPVLVEKKKTGESETVQARGIAY